MSEVTNKKNNGCFNFDIDPMVEVILDRGEQRLVLREWLLAKKLKKASDATGHRCTERRYWEAYTDDGNMTI